MHCVFAEGCEQVLAMGGDRVEDPAVDQRRARSERPLRAAHPHRLSGEVLGLVARQAMQGMTFRHPEKSATTGQRSRGTRFDWSRSGCEVAQDVSQCAHPGRAVAQFGKLLR